MVEILDSKSVKKLDISNVLREMEEITVVKGGRTDTVYIPTETLTNNNSSFSGITRVAQGDNGKIYRVIHPKGGKLRLEEY